jgi:WD40 repeat protein
MSLGNRLAIYGWDDVIGAKESLPKALGEEEAHRRVINRLAFASDGTLLTVGDEDGLIVRWSVAGGALKRLSSEQASPYPMMLAPHPSQPWVAEGLRHNRVLRVREALTGDLVSRLVGDQSQALRDREAETSMFVQGTPGHGSPIVGGVFSPDGARLYTISGGPNQANELRVWDTSGSPSAHSEWIPVLSRPAEGPTFKRIDVSGDGRSLLTVAEGITSEGGARQFLIEVWDVRESP